MGGKFRQGKKISEFIHMVLKPDQYYVEPFCGALGVATKVNHNKMILADISESLINMWLFFQNNPDFELPDVVTEEEYNAIKNIRDPNDWRTAYYGFGLTFGAKWFGTFARNNRAYVNYAGEAKRGTDKKRGLISRGTKPLFVFSEYTTLEIPATSVIYCDPPYQDRVNPHNYKGKFDHLVYWQWCRDKVAEGHILLATEFVVPDDFVVLHNFGDTVVRHYAGKGSDGTQEVLVCHESQAHLWGVQS